MSENQFSDRLFGTRLSRRAALQGAGALGVAATFASHREVFALTQDATPTTLDYPEVTINAIEYAFDMPTSIESGFTKITFNNQGTMDHHAMFMRVNDGSTMDDVKAALKTGDLGALFTAATGLGGPGCAPGETTSVVFDLLPGQYLVICVIPNEEGIPHAALGMMTEVEVTEGTSTAVAPTADATVHLADFAFHDMPTEIAAGPVVWEVTDDGPQIHELGVCQLQPGFTFTQVQMMMMAPPPATPAAGDAATAASSPMAMEMAPPFIQVDGVAPMSAGQTNWLLLDLEAGDYFAICFVPDPATSAPHFALGMMMPFTVSA